MVKFTTEIQLNKSTMSVLRKKVLLGISGGIAAYKTAFTILL
jgi:phosphopantothenoylcysteine synthetase/decarboxylase